MGPLVSVVVPCFNAERWLGAALDSALAQTWAPLEVIVVDDGSTDGSVDVARSFGDRVTVLTGPNQGPSAARNRGLGVARGEHVQFLDSDDLLLPTKIAACLAIRRHPHDVPFARLLPFGRPEPTGLGRAAAGLAARLRREPRFDPSRPIETALTFEVQTSQPVYPAGLLRAVGGFRRELKWLEDIDLNLRLVLAGARFRPVDEPLVLLRDHAGPGRQRLAPGAAVGRIEGEKSMMAVVREADRFTPGVARVFADRLAYAGRQAWRAGQRDAAREAFALAHSLHPRPRPTGIPLYNAVSAVVGLERTERWASRSGRA